MNDSCHGENQTSRLTPSLLFKRRQYEKRINLLGGVGARRTSALKNVFVFAPLVCIDCELMWPNKFGCSIFRACHVIWWKSNSIFRPPHVQLTRNIFPTHPLKHNSHINPQYPGNIDCQVNWNFSDIPKSCFLSSQVTGRIWLECGLIAFLWSIARRTRVFNYFGECSKGLEKERNASCLLSWVMPVKINLF